MGYKIILCLSLLLFLFPSFSQTRILKAVKIEQAPKIDGNLEEDEWEIVKIIK